MSTGTVSYWESTAFPRTADLVIIGAGITGCSAALHVLEAQPDARVVLLERSVFPSGASTRNAGFACFGSVSELLDDLNHTPEEEVIALIERRYNGLELLRSRVPADVMEFSLCGGHELFTDRESFETCKDSLMRINGWLESISGEKDVYVPAEVNGYPVIFNKLEGYLHSGRLMRYLHAEVESRGGRILWNTPVRGVREGVVTIRDGEEFEARGILVATNGFSRELLPDVQISPARGYIMVTSELSNQPWKGPWHYDRGFIYFRDLGSRLLLGGARNVDIRREETSIDKVNPLIKAHLIKFAREVLRIEENWTIEHEWTGIMGFPESKTPVLRQLGPGVWLAAGLGGMGVALGMQFGKDAAGKVLEEFMV